MGIPDGHLALACRPPARPHCRPAAHPTLQVFPQLLLMGADSPLAKFEEEVGALCYVA